MSSSLFLQQGPEFLVRLTWIVFVMGGRYPYSWCLIGCCRQDLFTRVWVCVCVCVQCMENTAIIIKCMEWTLE